MDNYYRRSLLSINFTFDCCCFCFIATEHRAAANEKKTRGSFMLAYMMENHQDKELVQETVNCLFVNFNYRVVLIILKSLSKE